MDKEHLILIGFFIFFSMQAIVLIGHFRFYMKGYEFVTVQGTSMLPTLKNGEKAIVNYNIPEGNLTNMIVVFGDTNICHRCIKDEGQWLTFKGDNSSSFEHATRDELKAIFVKVAQDPFLDSVILGLQ
jgi:signal peptidase I